MAITREQAIANINSNKSTSAEDKARAISMLDRYFPQTSTPTTTSNTTSNSSLTNQPGKNYSDSFLSAIQEKLLGQSGVISSTNSQIEDKLNAAISGLQTSAEKSNQAIESAYGRERAFMEGQSNLNVQQQLEGRSGFGTQMVALRNLVETTDKNLNDLEQRKNELIMQNDAQAASKISDLQFQALQFKQQAQQQVFSNLLNIANFGLQSAQEERLNRQQTFTEQQSMREIALQYGITIKPGETFDSLTNRAMAVAAPEAAARLAKMQSEVRYTNAQTAKILAGDGNNAVVNDNVIATLASQWNNLKGQNFSVESNQEMQNILAMFDTPEKLNKFYKAVADDASGRAKADVMAMQEKASANVSNKTYGLQDLGTDIMGSGVNISRSLLDFLYGKKSGSKYDYGSKSLVPNQ